MTETIGYYIEAVVFFGLILAMVVSAFVVLYYHDGLNGDDLGGDDD